MPIEQNEAGDMGRDSVVRIIISGQPESDAHSKMERKAVAQLMPWLELLTKLVPSFAVLVVILTFRPEISAFMSRASKVELLGIKLERGDFEKRLDAASSKLDPSIKTPEWAEIPFKKLRLAATAVREFKILWVDDHPASNFNVRRILSEMGAKITVATNNTEAISEILRHDFDIIISDFNRDPPLNENGGELSLKMVELKYEAKFLFYTWQPQNIPKGSKHLIATSDPAILLSTIADLAISRIK